ncbi:ABC transporter ATP-binding protein [Desulfogranum japonicum]|uniref:ABC transporter ATP-binding protein n=1 Tax=Desulfogranum japonicum TaxID=231447 RepID=UPI000415BA69|nr:ABC transporter ATP-binding protein [Desulfogranum japonicum]
MVILEARNISRTYTIGERETQVLKDISLTINAGEFVVIAGSSGSGKSTLLSILSGLDQPTSGRIFLSGQDITDLNEDQLAEVRNQTTGFVFQAFHLIPSLNALENVTFPAELSHDPQAYKKAETLLKRVGLWERKTHFPSQLSGGEKQRVALCRALINSPPLVFADEPTGNLDSKNSSEIVRLLLEMQHEWNTTLVMATHSLEIAERAERMISLRDGRIEPDYSQRT